MGKALICATTAAVTLKKNLRVIFCMPLYCWVIYGRSLLLWSIFSPVIYVPSVETFNKLNRKGRRRCGLYGGKPRANCVVFLFLLEKLKKEEE